MTQRVTISWIVNTSIITAFSIAAALIWKDVIIDFINIIVPPSEQLFYKFIAAVIATFIVVIAIYLILRAESRAERIFGLIRRANNNLTSSHSKS